MARFARPGMTPTDRQKKTAGRKIGNLGKREGGGAERGNARICLGRGKEFVVISMASACALACGRDAWRAAEGSDDPN